MADIPGPDTGAPSAATPPFTGWPDSERVGWAQRFAGAPFWPELAALLAGSMPAAPDRQSTYRYDSRGGWTKVGDRAGKSEKPGASPGQRRRQLDGTGGSVGGAACLMS